MSRVDLHHTNKRQCSSTLFETAEGFGFLMLWYSDCVPTERIHAPSCIYHSSDLPKEETTVKSERLDYYSYPKKEQQFQERVGDTTDIVSGKRNANLKGSIHKASVPSVQKTDTCSTSFC